MIAALLLLLHFPVRLQISWYPYTHKQWYDKEGNKHINHCTTVFYWGFLSHLLQVCVGGRLPPLRVYCHKG